MMEQLAELCDPKVYVEQRVDCSRWIPECSGTCDALIISDGILHIIDLKYGRGVKVDAECYARVSLSFYAYNSSGNRGIACGLQNIQKIRDGESLGGKAKAEDDFNDGFSSDDDSDYFLFGTYRKK